MEDTYHCEYYYPQDPLYPGLDLQPDFPSPAPWPSPRSPVHPPPPQPAPAPSFPPHTSATRGNPTAPGRRGPQQNLATRGQASRRSDQGPYVCGEEKANGKTCGKTFGLQKDLNRHLKTLHASKDAKKFVCCCNKSDYRRDNHIRHVKSCKVAAVTTDYFFCKQGHWHDSKKEHLQHLEDECR